jgi:hypothetical protein
VSPLRPSSGLRLFAAILLLSAAPAINAAAAPEEQEEVPRYTDEDLQRRRHTPQRGDASGEEAKKAAATQKAQTAPSAGDRNPAVPVGEGKGSQTKKWDPWAKRNPAQSRPVPQSTDEWLEKSRDDARRREYWEGRVRAAQERVQALEARLEYLERKKASAQNPFLPRVELEPEDAEAEAGLDGVQRLARAEAKLAETRGELETARQAVELERQRAREALRTAGVPTN